MAIRRAESLYYRKPFPRIRLKDKFAAGPVQEGEYQVLILGTSRTYNGIHPGFI